MGPISTLHAHIIQIFSIRDT